MIYFWRKYVLLASSIFCIFVLIGGALEYFIFYDASYPAEAMIDGETKWYEVFMNNLIVILFMVLGIFLFGTITFLLLAFNGWIVGMALVSSYSEGASVVEIVGAIVPHGIFEVPAIIAAAAIGFVGFKFYDQMRNKQLYKYTGFMLAVAVLLLFAASIVETMVTSSL
ncbi:stage II sporulation protein M [Shouchella lonarensis]|uniref:Stage II sporulation protein M n=1 Tax=Shouchella lonarensis TaxID=1464122 RepID=A0A1G6GU54_9BACI|nr:stage II sporulation protein M [Shouchella lonarensis]SDB85537.1 Stage II sporulation protein M [Shouchella lonarensis]